MGFGEKGLALQMGNKEGFEGSIGEFSAEVVTWSEGTETTLGGFCHVQLNKHFDITLAFIQLGDCNTGWGTLMFE